MEPQPNNNVAKWLGGLLVVLILAVIGGYIWKTKYAAVGPEVDAPATTTPTETLVSDVYFGCDGGKSLYAKFYDKHVELDLSDGRKFILPQAVSASGARYANSDESVVFWNKGNGANLMEGIGASQNTTYQNCVGGKG